MIWLGAVILLVFILPELIDWYAIVYTILAPHPDKTKPQ